MLLFYFLSTLYGLNFRVNWKRFSSSTVLPKWQWGGWYPSNTHIPFTWALKFWLSKEFIEGSLFPFVVYNNSKFINKPVLCQLCRGKKNPFHQAECQSENLLQFLVSSDVGEIHKHPAVFPLPLKICCGLSPNCKQYSVSLKSVPVPCSSREREAAVHTWFCFRSWSPPVLSKSSVQDNCS